MASKAVCLTVSLTLASIISSCGPTKEPLEVGLRAASAYSHPVQSGKVTQFYETYQLMEDCKPLRGIRIRIVSPPQHGTATIVATRGYPSYRASNVREKCNKRQVPMMAVRYRSNPGYVGTDVVKLHTDFPLGAPPDDITTTFNVQ